MGAYASPASEGHMNSYPGPPDEADVGRTDIRRVAVAASRIRAALLFVFLDAVSVVIGYGLAEVTYFRDRAPADYWKHFAEFLAVAVVVTLISNQLFGLYGRMWRHAGADEARQLLLSAATTLCVLIAFWPAGHTIHIELVPPVRGGRRLHVRRGRHGDPPVPLAPLRLAAGLQTAGPPGGRDRQPRRRRRGHPRDAPQPGCRPGAGRRVRRRSAGPRPVAARRARRRATSTTSRRRPAATPSSRSCWPSRPRRPSWSSGRCGPPRRPGCP